MVSYLSADLELRCRDDVLIADQHCPGDSYLICKLYCTSQDTLVANAGTVCIMKILPYRIQPANLRLSFYILFIYLLVFFIHNLYFTFTSMRFFYR